MCTAKRQTFVYDNINRTVCKTSIIPVILCRHPSLVARISIKGSGGWIQTTERSPFYRIFMLFMP